MIVGIDIENRIDKSKIWVCVTKDFETKEVKVWKEPKGLCEYLEKADTIVAHNLLSHDAPILNGMWKTKIRLSQCFDTLIVSRLLDPSLENGHSLEAWGERLGLQKIDYRAVWLWMTNRSEKDTPKLLEFDEPHEGLMDHYCVRDVDVLEVLYHHLVKELKDKEFSDQSVELEHKVAAIISKQTKEGFKLDVPYAISLVTTLKARMDTVLERAQELYPPRIEERYSEKTGKRLKDTTIVFNMGSRQQVAEKLQELGWVAKKHTEKGSIIVDEGVLDEIIESCGGA